MSKTFKALTLVNQAITRLEEGLLKRSLRINEKACDVDAVVGDRALKTFCSNDYLGLANHPALVTALSDGAQKYGVGSGASHLISGHSRAHELLENQLARFQSAHIPNARALFFSTGYMANLTAITGLIGLANKGEAHIYSAALNHASLIDGVRLASSQHQALVTIFDHLDLASLEKDLSKDTSSLKLIVIDGVFSMDGDLAPLNSLLQLANQYDALLMVDDAHGFGVLGEKGHGILEYLALHSGRLIYIGTLGKAAGVSGAFICATDSFIEWLIQKGRPYIYTTATSPAIAHAVSKSLDLIEGIEGKTRRKHLDELIKLWNEEMVFSCWQKASSSSAIQPVIIGSNAHALQAAKLLDAAGYWIPAIRPPTVPEGKARLRITFSANHTVDEVKELIQTLQKIESSMLVEGVSL
ncbi:8-amino-7-oxononanoate synthase [Polynucleobacter asymbioticus]|nr:8-amino-7-oxononanoate synthase [Polynucleobacter asymbioticus]